MLTFRISAARTRLKKASERLFVAHGWQIDRTSILTQDFVAIFGKLRLSVICLDASLANFRGTGSIISELYESARFHRDSLKRVLVVVLDENFLLLSLEQLLDRGTCVVAFDELYNITNSSRLESQLPATLSKYEQFICENSADYALSLSYRYSKNGDSEQALKWAEITVKPRGGAASAYLHLFSLYRDAGNVAKADEIANELLVKQKDDPRVMNLMLDYAKRRGDGRAVKTWEERIRDCESVPRVFEDILAKQRAMHQRNVDLTKDSRPVDPPSAISPAKRGFPILKALLRGFW